MAPKNQRTITVPGGGLFSELGNRIKLILRLMGDRRVSPLLKVLPVGSMVYLLFPDIVPLFLDDAVILWLGTTLFVELCPPAVVREHMDELHRVVTLKWDESANPEAIDAEFRETVTEGGESPRKD